MIMAQKLIDLPKSRGWLVGEALGETSSNHESWLCHDYIARFCAAGIQDVLWHMYTFIPVCPSLDNHHVVGGDRFYIALTMLDDGQGHLLHLLGAGVTCSADALEVQL